ncbi:hypothetical protein AC622_03210 [Bacillus sp. FJAT-27916]|uniref:small multi-drug export protein n=1 Tax=Bacillus sp. FJAT-27916 TaxID=1679169 RepID=UPI000670CB84|nr:small multi-drug export protein [Bacillus sp. FJAT-27916]KMY43384.1 hypothetical protein AC622_03210 [Bacillus sp. FJAT-27916]
MNNLSILESVIEANIFIQLGAVFLISFVPFLEGSTASVFIIFGFPAVPTLIVASFGNLLSVMVIIVLYEKISYTRNAKQKEGYSGKRMKLARKLFKKYGVPGISLLGPLGVGHHIGAVISLIAGAPKRYVALWMTIGILVWTIGTGVLVMLGVNLTDRLV